MKAKKSLGQHFLKSTRALGAIVDAGDPHGTDIVLEIGPGTGILTERLLAFAGKVIAVEKDKGLCVKLAEKFAEHINAGALDLVCGDALAFDPSMLKFYKGFTYKLISNIPYYITGHILEKFLAAEYQPERMVLLVQKEVAERIAAKNGKESILSLSVKVYGTPRIERKVSRREFSPVPTVDSAVLAITDISRKNFKDINEQLFFSIVKQGFAHPRKKALSNLSTLAPKQALAKLFAEAGIGENARAEDIPLETWLFFAKKLSPDVLYGHSPVL